MSSECGISYGYFGIGDGANERGVVVLCSDVYEECC